MLEKLKCKPEEVSRDFVIRSGVSWALPSRMVLSLCDGHLGPENATGVREKSSEELQDVLFRRQISPSRHLVLADLAWGLHLVKARSI